MKYYEISKTPVDLGRRLTGIYYAPAVSCENDHIGISFDYAPARFAEQLAMRGYRVLRLDQSHAMGFADPDDNFVSLSKGVDWMRSQSGIDTVLSFNWSGGNTPMTAYEAIAENGCKIFQNDERIIKVRDMSLTPSDGMICLDANYGNALMTLMSMDPAVEDERGGIARNPELDIWNPANGFTRGGTTYDRAFVAKIQAAQAARMNRYIDYCLERLALIEAGKGWYVDDEPLVIPGGEQVRMNNMLFSQDITLLSHTKNPGTLVHPDGSTTFEIVPTVRVACNDECLTPKYHGGARVTSVKAFLKGTAIRLDPDFGYDENTFHGVQWDSSYASPLANIQHIHIPLMTLGMTAGWEFLTAEILKDNCPSADKTAVFIEGATHGGFPERGTEEKYGDTLKNTFDQISLWIGDGSRFHK